MAWTTLHYIMGRKGYFYEIKRQKRTLAASSEAEPRLPRSLLTISRSSSRLLESDIWFVCDSESCR